MSNNHRNSNCFESKNFNDKPQFKAPSWDCALDAVLEDSGHGGVVHGAGDGVEDMAGVGHRMDIMAFVKDFMEERDILVAAVDILAAAVADMLVVVVDELQIVNASKMFKKNNIPKSFSQSHMFCEQKKSACFFSVYTCLSFVQ